MLISCQWSPMSDEYELDWFHSWCLHGSCPRQCDPESWASPSTQKRVSSRACSSREPFLCKDQVPWSMVCHAISQSIIRSQELQWKLSSSPEASYVSPHISRIPLTPRCSPPLQPSTTAAASLAPLPPSTSPNGSPTLRSLPKGAAHLFSASTVPETRLLSP